MSDPAKPRPEKSPTPPPKGTLMSFGEFVGEVFASVLMTQAHLGAGDPKRPSGFNAGLFAYIHQLYKSYRQMVLVEERIGWSDDFARMDYEIRRHLGEPIPDVYLEKFAPEVLEARARKARGENDRVADEIARALGEDDDDADVDVDPGAPKAGAR